MAGGRLRSGVPEGSGLDREDRVARSRHALAQDGPAGSTATEGKARKLVKVDFARQLRKTWGNRVFSAAEVAAMRAAELEGDQE